MDFWTKKCLLSNQRDFKTLTFWPCVKAEEGIIWAETSTKSLVRSHHHIPLRSWFHERSSRSNFICQKRWEVCHCCSGICGWHCLWIHNRSSSSWIFRRNETRVWGEHGVRVELLPRALSETTRRWDIHLPREICQKSWKEIWPRLQEPHFHSHEFLSKTESRCNRYRSGSNTLSKHDQKSLISHC